MAATPPTLHTAKNAVAAPPKAMVKILVCGDVEGRYSETFKRVAKLDKKAGPFDALFCVGAFYGEDRSVPAAPINGSPAFLKFERLAH